jgi:peptidyl-prolyl cis-trans isomerase C
MVRPLHARKAFLAPSFLRHLSFAFACLVCLACLPSAGCKDKAGAGAGDAPSHRTSEGLTSEQSAQVLAKIGDTTITLGDYAAALEHMDQFDRLRYQSPERRKELLNEMINVKLLAEEAHDKGYDKDPRTQEELRAVLRDAMLKEARKGAPAPADIPADEVRAYYDAHRAEFRDPERRRVSAIVLGNEAAARAVLDQAKKGLSAAEWGTLVRTKSVDPSAKVNVPVDLAGDLGMASPPGDLHGETPRMPEEVRAAAFSIGKVGDVAPEVVKAFGRFYVVRLTVKNDPQDRTFQEAERSIRVKLSQEKLRAREDALLDQLKAKFPVQIDDQAMASVFVDVPDGGFRAEPEGGTGGAGGVRSPPGDRADSSALPL